MMFSDRDRKLFFLLGQFRVMTLKQIQEYAFDGASRPIVQRRLGLFRKRGVLRSIQSSRYGQLAWTLCSETARGLDLEPRAFVRNPNLYCIEHDLILTEIGLNWHRRGLIDKWKPAIFFEIETKGKGLDNWNHIPDAAITGKLADGERERSYVEYENSLKTKKDLMWALYFYSQYHIDRVYYFWRNRSIPKIMWDNRHEIESKNSRIWIADKSIEEGMPDTFTCLLTREKLDLKDFNDPPTNPATQSDTRNNTEGVL
jgi:hypothetical protein